jgi:hypothetical protein
MWTVIAAWSCCPASRPAADCTQTPDGATAAPAAAAPGSALAAQARSRSRPASCTSFCACYGRGVCFEVRRWPRWPGQSRARAAHSATATGPSAPEHGCTRSCSRAWAAAVAGLPTAGAGTVAVARTHPCRRHGSGSVSAGSARRSACRREAVRRGRRAGFPRWRRT